MKGHHIFIAGIFILCAVLLTGIMFMANRSEQVFAKEVLLPNTTATLGNPEASLTLVEFSDFQCPACRAYAPIVKALAEKYPDTLIIGYRHFPLPQHEFAQYAALAAEAAGKQGKFWEMSDYLFVNQAKISKELINNGAAILELNEDQFFSDIESNELQAQIQTDKSDGAKFGVNATPTFFLNGKKLNLKGPQDLQVQIESHIQSLQ